MTKTCANQERDGKKQNKIDNITKGRCGEKEIVIKSEKRKYWQKQKCEAMKI